MMCNFPTALVMLATMNVIPLFQFQSMKNDKCGKQIAVQAPVSSSPCILITRVYIQWCYWQSVMLSIDMYFIFLLFVLLLEVLFNVVPLANLG